LLLLFEEEEAAAGGGRSCDSVVVVAVSPFAEAVSSVKLMVRTLNRTYKGTEKSELENYRYNFAIVFVGFTSSPMVKGNSFVESPSVSYFQTQRLVDGLKADGFCN
jgi:hypothetical protein